MTTDIFVWFWLRRVLTSVFLLCLMLYEGNEFRVHSAVVHCRTVACWRSRRRSDDCTGVCVCISECRPLRLKIGFDASLPIANLGRSVFVSGDRRRWNHVTYVYFVIIGFSARHAMID